MAVVGGEREIPPRGNLLRSGKTGTQQMAGAGTLYPEQTVHLTNAFLHFFSQVILFFFMIQFI